MFDDLTKLIQDAAVNERAHKDTKRDLGGVFFCDRIATVCAFAFDRIPGDVLEIGVYAGTTSKRLAGIAAMFGRRYLGIDNWLPHPDYKHDEMEPIARAAIAEHSKYAIMTKIDAHSAEGLELISSRPWAFVLSDDGHAYADHLSELQALSRAMTRGIVCVDDIYVPDVRRAIDDVVKAHGWREVFASGLREAYLVRE